MNHKEFYSELGKLLYAVIDNDGVVSKSEKERLKTIVKKQLVPLEHHVDAYGTNIAFYSEMEFDVLEDTLPDIESTFNSFMDFVEEHQTEFDDTMKKVSLIIVKELSNVYLGTNKLERRLIDQLTKRLNKIKIKKRTQKIRNEN
ncbi:MAG TPA: hypothetical protein VLB84_14875 [Bacteroidia bacterium]|jgi:hypothetical protein|nr:hypothetical protein [Bacteroidia bacterium]